mmetsp:Transcript_15057/g.27113  ORF Transcript_15057/g.27113 Transcript_15057/m.27113 type:complete len:247 (-) Transcript_15057:98-838(-)|eukprot:CAMPEP_0197522246 /NCGR_PEP_ID=MMETSP1318-20131121/7429_1 /TAXON_ID=552666 /ORGANISM="Partenskyella glossopodia, Strain RCC365" /LENGTH=246 /DNA_ID=CAMNT_0043074559 /DNA_START=323 /DNA_END=1063 /DNA_ORIENTATION=+
MASVHVESGHLRRPYYRPQVRRQWALPDPSLCCTKIDQLVHVRNNLPQRGLQSVVHLSRTPNVQRSQAALLLPKIQPTELPEPGNTNPAPRHLCDVDVVRQNVNERILLLLLLRLTSLHKASSSSYLRQSDAVASKRVHRDAHVGREKQRARLGSRTHDNRVRKVFPAVLVDDANAGRAWSGLMLLCGVLFEQHGLSCGSLAPVTAVAVHQPPPQALHERVTVPLRVVTKESRLFATEAPTIQSRL